MKNHIALKFIAIILCAAALLGAITSGGGIIMLFALDLYDTTVEEYYEQTYANQSRRFASDLVSQYASRTLGNCQDHLVREYFNLWQMENLINSGQLEYELIDPETGEILDSQYSSQESSLPWREVPGIGGYLKLLEDPAQTIPEETHPQETAPTELTEETLPPTTPDTPETIPEETVADQAVPESQSAESAAASEEAPEQPETEQPTEAVTEVTEEAAAPAAEAQTEAPTELPTEAAAEEPTQAATEAPTEALTEPPAQEEDGFYYSGWDSQTQQHRDSRVAYLSAPEYTVRLRLHNVGYTDENLWELLRLTWNVRYELYKVLGACLLVFAVLIVYLCCAAGRKSGTQEIRAGGLNRIPLDGYLVALGTAAVCAIGVGGPVLIALAEYSMEGAVTAYCAVGGVLSLLIVHFLFAFAAQVKTPGGFWYRNSACGLALRALVWVYNNICIAVLAWAFGILGKVLRWAWPLGKRLFRALWKLVQYFWLKGCQLLRWTWKMLTLISKQVWEKFRRFFGMLPLTWQWLVVAFVMIFVLALTVSSRSTGVVVLGIAACIALVLYGAGAFGILLESAKRMRQGDLDTKIQDNLLIGSFREFAGELNGLADVAVVAAQKQLKSERMKTELITNVSHDIKTPLTSIINYVDLMKRPHSEAEQQQYMEVLDRQSQRLKKLIDDLMEMSKASTGNLTVEIEVVDAAEAVNQALGEFADKLEKVPLHPVFRQPEEAISMLADGKLTWRVLSNILSNACKYALPGTRLYVDVSKLEGKVIISLKNISREELNVEADELMERFVRGDASRNAEGSGLGLNIAKSLMQLQQGELQLLVDGDLFKVTLVFPEG